jgi:hypothetical protein
MIIKRMDDHSGVFGRCGCNGHFRGFINVAVDGELPHALPPDKSSSKSQYRALPKEYGIGPLIVAQYTHQPETIQSRDQLIQRLDDSEVRVGQR